MYSQEIRIYFIFGIDNDIVGILVEQEFYRDKCLHNHFLVILKLT